MMLDQLKQFGANLIDRIHWRANRWTPQVRAAVQPYSSCFAHAAASWLQNFNIQVTPDEVMREVNSPKWVKEAIRIEGRAVAEQYAGKINQLWRVMEAYLTDRLHKAGILADAVFCTSMTDRELVASLRHGPVICGVRPLYRGRILGHVDLIVGRIDGMFIVDDSFGNPLEGYPSNLTGGNDVPISPEKLRKLLSGMFIYIVRRI